MNEESDNLKDQAESDQAIARLADMLPRVVRGMYDKFLELEFTRDEAFTLCQTWILMNCPHGIKGTGK